MDTTSLVSPPSPPPSAISKARRLRIVRPLPCASLSFSVLLKSSNYEIFRSNKVKRSYFTKIIRSSLNNVSTETEINNNNVPTTGSAYDFKGATTSLTDNLLLSCPKKVTLVRHGLSSWNVESRVQGSSNLSVLTETGAMQAEKCRDALINMNFDICFSSPISRAKSTAELIWRGREQPLQFLDSLKEAHLFFLEGMTNGSGC